MLSGKYQRLDEKRVNVLVSSFTCKSKNNFHLKSDKIRVYSLRSSFPATTYFLTLLLFWGSQSLVLSNCFHSQEITLQSSSEERKL